jgi:hypothetical protein
MAKIIVSQKILDGKHTSLPEASSLWGFWWSAILLLRPAFSHARTFMWFAVIVAGLTVGTDMLGVTSIIRALKLHPRCYDSLLKHFHSEGVRIDSLAALWGKVVALQLFADKQVRVGGRRVLVGDGIKIPKRGKKMPAVKLVHQESHARLRRRRRHGRTLGRTHPRRRDMVQRRQANAAYQNARSLGDRRR